MTSIPTWTRGMTSGTNQFISRNEQVFISWHLIGPHEMNSCWWDETNPNHATHRCTNRRAFFKPRKYNVTLGSLWSFIPTRAKQNQIWGCGCFNSTKEVLWQRHRPVIFMLSKSKCLLIFSVSWRQPRNIDTGCDLMHICIMVYIFLHIQLDCSIRGKHTMDGGRGARTQLACRCRINAL